jgi:hypothetical protein
VAVQAKTFGVAKAKDAAVKDQIQKKVKYTDNSKLGKIETPASEEGEHTDFEPQGIKETIKHGVIITTYTTKSGQSFKVIQDEKTGLIRSVKGTGLRLKVPGGPRGVTKDSPAFRTGMDMNRSHLIADEFGGSGYKEGLNLISASDYYNKTVMRGAEVNIGDWVEAMQGTSFSMKVDVTWGEVQDSKILKAIEAAPWYPKKYKKAANLEAEIAAKLKSVPKLKRCIAVKYKATITGSSIPGNVGKMYTEDIGPDEHLLLEKE